MFRKKYLKNDGLDAVREGNIEKGIALYKQYLDLEENSEDDDAWASLGGAYRRKGCSEKAISCYKRAFAINNESTYAVVNVVSLAAGENDVESHKEYLETAIELTEKTISEEKADHWTWFDLATLQLISGEAKKAEGNFQFAADMKSCTVENIKSALSNLENLKTRNKTYETEVNRVIDFLNMYIERKQRDRIS